MSTDVNTRAMTGAQAGRPDTTTPVANLIRFLETGTAPAVTLIRLN